MDAPEEFTTEERVESLIAKGYASSGGDTIVGGAMGMDEAPTTQIHSIDTLLGDIYEL